MNHFYKYLFSFFIILSTFSCYKDVIQFTPDFIHQKNTESFVSQFFDISTIYQFTQKDEAEFITLSNGFVIEITPESLQDKNGQPITQGPITVKFSTLKSGSSSLIVAPSLVFDQNPILAQTCFKISFYQENNPLVLVQPITYYLPQELGTINSQSQLFGYLNGDGVEGWSVISPQAYILKYGIWTMSNNKTVKGLKLTTMSHDNWICLGQNDATKLENTFSLIIKTNSELHDSNALVFFINKEKNSMVRLKGDINGQFTTNIKTESEKLSGYVIVLSDTGEAKLPFALKEISLENNNSAIEIIPMATTKEDIKAALSAL